MLIDTLGRGAPRADISTTRERSAAERFVGATQASCAAVMYVSNTYHDASCPMETNLLRTFVTVAQCKHLTRASQILHLTQPAVSGHIKALEELLEVRLFERSSAGVALTPAGQALLPKAEAALLAVSAVRHAAKALQGQLTGKLTLGTILDPNFIRLGEFISLLREHHPALDIELHQGISPWVMEAVSNGTLDAAFFMGDKIHPAVRATSLAKLVYRVVAPPPWRERIEHADWPDLAELPWVRGLSNSPHVHMISEVFASYNLTPRKAVEADQESTIIDLIAAGVGVGLMRENLAFEAEQRGEVCIWPRARLETTLAFVYLHEREEDPFIRVLDAAVHELWNPTA